MRRTAAALCLAVVCLGLAGCADDFETTSKSLYEAGRYTEAEAAAERVLERKGSETELRREAIALHDDGSALDAQGNYSKAEGLFRRALTIGRRAGFNDAEMAVCEQSLGTSLKGQARFAEAETVLKNAAATNDKSRGANKPIREERIWSDLAGLYVAEARYAEAEMLFKQAISDVEKVKGADDIDVAQLLGSLADLYWSQGRDVDAEPLIKRSLAIYQQTRSNEHPYYAEDLSALATLYSSEQRYGEAEPLFRRSLALKEAKLGSDNPSVARSLNNLAEMYRRQGRYAEAEPLYKQALAIEQKALGAETPAVATILNNLAMLYESQKRYGEAEPLYQRSLAIREKALGASHPVVADGLDNLAGLYDREGLETKAFDFSRQAVAILAARLGREAEQPGQGEVSERRSKRNDFLRNVAFAYEVEKSAATTENFATAQLADASSAADAVAGMAARFAAGSDALAAVVRQRQDLAQRSQGLDASLVESESKPAAQQDSGTTATLRQQLVDADKQLAALDARIVREFPQYAELSNPKPLELKRAQALLASDEAMLVYLVGDKESWLWAVRKDKAQVYKLDIDSKTLTAEVAALRSKLDPELNADLAPFDAKRAYALYQKIVSPAAPLLAGAHEVFVVPDGAIESLPLGVLVTKAPAANPETAADHRKVAWLAKDYALTVLPSVGSLKALRAFAKDGHAPDPFAGIGNPVLDGKPGSARGVKLASLFRGAEADVDAVRQLPPLPETANELRAVAKDMGAGPNDLYLADRATEPMLRQAGLDRFRVIEFATHGLMSGDLQGLAEPALVLTPPKVATPDDDGLLTASKVATLKLDADWVVLSACNTAASDGTPDAGGLSGLAKAFFYAGARSLLVSNWSVSSAATVKLITGAFGELKKDPALGRAEALRRAEMAMLDPTNPPEFAHPMMWAPFVLAGEGGAGRSGDLTRVTP